MDLCFSMLYADQDAKTVATVDAARAMMATIIEASAMVRHEVDGSERAA